MCFPEWKQKWAKLPNKFISSEQELTHRSLDRADLVRIESDGIRRRHSMPQASLLFLYAVWIGLSSFQDEASLLPDVPKFMHSAL